jgi:hypothetical protein
MLHLIEVDNEIINLNNITNIYRLTKGHGKFIIFGFSIYDGEEFFVQAEYTDKLWDYLLKLCVYRATKV